MRKFLKTEIDLMYNELNNDEEVLWRGKPRVIPNFSYMSTLIFLILVSVLLTLLRFFKLKELQISYKDWYTTSLIVITIFIFVYSIWFIDNYYQKMKNIFYVVTNKRLVIFDSKKESIIYNKLYPTIKILRLKKTLFDNYSIIFDFKYNKEKLVEIGFNNIEDGEEVMNIINKQLTHLREKEIEE